MFDWILRRRRSREDKIIRVIEKVAAAAERQADACERSHRAAVKFYESATEKNEEERGRRKVVDDLVKGKT